MADITLRMSHDADRNLVVDLLNWAQDTFPGYHQSLVVMVGAEMLSPEITTGEIEGHPPDIQNCQPPFDLTAEVKALVINGDDKRYWIWGWLKWEGLHRFWHLIAEVPRP